MRNHGTAVGAAGTVLRTTDGGSTSSNQAAERPMASWLFHLLMPTPELQLARMEQSSGLRTEEIPGLAKQVGRPTISTPFHLAM